MLDFSAFASHSLTMFAEERAAIGALATAPSLGATNILPLILDTMRGR